MILAQLSEAIDATSKVSPYNSYAYGFVVLLLVVACWVLWKQWKYWQDKHTANVEKTIILLNDVNKHLESNVNAEYQRQEILAKLAELREHILFDKK